ncbi:MAG: trimeric intracellular cation channel family protein, partial [Rhodospirillaceae bacterium]
IGGGTVRDLLLDLPVFWIEEPANLLTCVGVSVLVFFTAHIPQSRYKLLLLVDAIGLALFAAAGAERAVLAGADPSVAIAMGCITATFGGIIRDMLGAESPVVLSQEIYVTAAFAGSVIMVVGLSLDLPRAPCLITAFMVTLVIRLAAIRWNLALPRYKPRPGRAPEDIES